MLSRLRHAARIRRVFAPIRVRSAVRRLRYPVKENPTARISVLTRYSVLMTASTHWRVSSERSFQEYRQMLFSADRLEERLALFENVLLSSLRAQTLAMQKGVRDLVILTSTELPRDHRERLMQAVSGLDWIAIEDVPPDAPQLPAPTLGGYYASVRIDDDDGLGPRFLSRLSGYVRPEYEGFAVTFPSGKVGNIGADNRVLHYTKNWCPNVSAGMSLIVGPSMKKRSAYQAGTHNIVHHYTPLILDPAPGMYLQSRGRFRDSAIIGSS
jgi:hypothetical protein